MRSPSRVNRDNIPGRRTHQAVERIASSAGPPMEERGRKARASRANEADFGMTERVWHVRHVAPSGYGIKDAMPYPTLEDAIKQARYWLSRGATDAWIIDADGNRIAKSEIEAS
jgi:hypothetical protein